MQDGNTMATQAMTPKERLNMSDYRIELQRVFKAPINLVFDSWTSVESLKQWHCGTVSDAKMQLEAGGKFMIQFEPEEDCDNTIVRGNYLSVNRPNQLIYKWKWDGSDEDTTVTVEFVEQSAQSTLVRLVHSKMDTEFSRDNHKTGWNKCLNGLEEFLAKANVS